MKNNMYMYVRNFKKLFLTISIEEDKKNKEGKKNKIKVLTNSKC